MTKQETLKILALLKSVYSGFARDIDSRTMADMWHEMLEDIDYSAASQALKKWISTEKWSPTIADIRAMVRQETETEADQEWAEAWKEVTRAISKHGYYREMDALNSMSPITRHCVEAIGWKNICNSEEIGVERGHFRSMYEAKAKSVSRAKQVPKGLRTVSENKMLNRLYGELAENLKLN